tara:strand:- start:42 stop:1364 length:1323 start_codon:yes stop_codon:yes gene_type:complete
MVKDKINYRARGPRTNLTRQTVGGRANDGGLRIGEMERDGVLAHGMAKFLNESLMVRGDEYHIAVCNKTGLLAVYNKERNIFLSPHVDGPLKFTENKDGNMNIDVISNHGKSFSILRVPYSFKLLIQELAAMNVQLRIITSENIDQISSMSYSNNINKLLQTSETNITNTIRNLVKNNRNNKSKITIKPSEKIPAEITIEPTEEPFLQKDEEKPISEFALKNRWDPRVDKPPKKPLPIGYYGKDYTILGEKIQRIEEPKTPDIPPPPSIPVQIAPIPNETLQVGQRVKLASDPTNKEYTIVGVDGNDVVVKLPGSTSMDDYKITNIADLTFATDGIDTAPITIVSKDSNTPTATPPPIDDSISPPYVPPSDEDDDALSVGYNPEDTPPEIEIVNLDEEQQNMIKENETKLDNLSINQEEQEQKDKKNDDDSTNETKKIIS